jgi:hypothetical protein
METQQLTRLEQLTNEANSIMTKAYKLKEVRSNLLAHYKKHEDLLNSETEEKFNSYSIISHILAICEFKEKESKTESLKKRVLKLERHKYAPEMNKLHFTTTDGKLRTVETPQCTTIDKAIRSIIVNKDLPFIQTLLYTTKITSK